jgi:hypothetical protein
MAGRREQVMHRGFFDHLARVHHHHPLGRFGDHAHRVRDQHHRHAHLLLELGDQVQDLRLDGDVQRGGGLVGDQQAGLQDSAIAIITRWRMPPENWCG